MKSPLKAVKIAIAVLPLVFLSGHALSAQDNSMSFFVMSVGSGKGGDLGGLEGTDAHCAKLAEAADVIGKTWRAYLSTQEEGERGCSLEALGKTGGAGLFMCFAAD